MKKLIFLFTLLPLLTGFVLAQTVSFSSIVEELDPDPCGTMEADAALRAQYPGAGTLDDFEVWLQQKMAERRENSGQRSAEVIVIPVVVHVLHNGTAVGVNQNLSFAQIQSQIDVLNEDFRRALGTPGFNTDSVGADTEIEFCLAALDNTGQLMTEPGVNRIDRNTAGFNAFPFNTGYMDATVKPATIWDPNVYFNIWVVPLPSGLLGYAQFPESSGLQGLGGPYSPDTDGIVINTPNFGRIGNVSSPYDKGRTATHEAGHFFGLRHIWGDGGCGVDDYCDDTPASDAANEGCNLNHVSCGTVDMVRNYMDYSNDACSNIFTLCQKERMRTVLENSPRRAGLVTSGACAQPTGPPVTAFSIRDTFTCDGRVEFIDQSDPFATNWFWVFSDGQFSTQRNPIVTFANSGTYTATLVSNNYLGSGTAVVQSFNITIDPIINTSAGPNFSVCIGDQVQLNGSTGALNPTSISWFPTTGLSDPTVLNPTLTVGSTPSYALTVTSASGCTASDTVAINVNGLPTVLAFPLNAQTISLGDSVQLNAVGALLYVWTPPAGLSNPNIANPWAKPSVTTIYTVTGYNAAGCSNTDEVLITIPGTVGLDGRLFGDVGRVHPAFPNPAQEAVTFSAALQLSGELRISLSDLTGKSLRVIHHETVFSGEFAYTWQRDPAFAAGLYLATWEMNGRRFVQKVELY